MHRIICIFLTLVLHSEATAQTDEIDVSSLPTASYTEQFTSVDRWGQMIGNTITVDFRYNEDSTLTFTPSLIETALAQDTATYILFPSSGSETDIFIYKIDGMNEYGFNIDYNVLKEKIIMWGASSVERAIRIDDLDPGFYHVNYVSCNYYGSYVLHITAPSIQH